MKDASRRIVRLMHSSGGERPETDAWPYNLVFKEEPVRQRSVPISKNLPFRLRKARAIEREREWASRQSIFLKQAMLLADYEDDFDYHGDPVRYYPTYQSLTDEELRGYFSWRTRVRKGEFCPAPLTFIFLHIYELINQVGVKTPLEGYETLLEIRRKYGSSDGRISYYLKQWLIDYVIYYDLDKTFLEDMVQVGRDECVNTLEHIQEEKRDKVIDAIKHLSPGWLLRSRFYAARYEDMDAVIFRVLKRMSAYYAQRCKKTMVEQFFGMMTNSHVHMFSTAVFCDPMKRRDYEYALDGQCVYRCVDGIWSINRRVVSPHSSRRLDKLLKTIDCLMRQAYGYGHPIKQEISTKWITRTIQEEIQALAEEKQELEKRKVTIDFSRLEKIREDAFATQERLIVEEEAEPPAEAEPAPPAKDANQDANTPLEAAEYRLLQCLLYGGDLGWLKSEGHMLAVLVDGINEKLYDLFGDSVMDDNPAIVEDYIDDLKEIIHP